MGARTGGNDDRRAEKDGREHIALNRVVGNAGQHGEAVALAHAELLRHPRVEVRERNVPPAHGLGRARAAGRKRQRANAVRANLHPTAKHASRAKR